MLLKGIKIFLGSRTFAGVLFLLPALILISVFGLYQIGRGIFLSLTDLNVIRIGSNFIGLTNYASIIHDPVFWKALRNTCYFIILNVPMNYLFAFMIALLLNMSIKAKSFFRVAYFIPVITSMVAVSIMWIVFYAPSGPIDSVVRALGFSGMKFLNSTSQAMPSIVITSVWSSAPYYAIIFLASLQSIPTLFYEAAKLDGANRWQSFILITLPLMKSASVFVIIITVISGFQVFTQVFIMTHGGPAMATTTLVHRVYLLAFEEYALGYASAMATILLAMLLVVTMLEIRLLKVRFEY